MLYLYIIKSPPKPNYIGFVFGGDLILGHKHPCVSFFTLHYERTSTQKSLISSIILAKMNKIRILGRCINLWKLSQLRILLQCRRPWFYFWVRKIRWRKDRLPIPVFLGFPGGSAGKESACNVGDLGSIPGLGRSPGEGKGYLIQYSDLENSLDCIVHGLAKSRTRLSDFHYINLYQMNWV